MEVKRGFKETEIGAIPEDWQLEPLEQLSAFITKGSTPTTYGFKWEPDGVLFLRSECVSDHGLDLTQSMYISIPAHDAFRRSAVCDGDILITITGNVGRVVMLTGVGVANLNQHIARVRVNAPRVDARFVFHYLTQSSVRKRFCSITTGQAYPQISLKQVREAHITLPPTKTEQQAISEMLDTADALIESLEQLLAKKLDLKQGAMQELLTGKRRLPGFVGKWEEKPLERLFRFGGGVTASRDQLSQDGYCYLHYGDIHGSSKTYVDVKPEYQDIPKLRIPLNRVPPVSLLNDGDVVFVDASEDDEGTSRHLVVINPDKIPFIAGLHTIVAKSTTDELEPAYRRYCFQTAAVKGQFRFYAVGTKVSGISKSNIARIALPLPSCPEQLAIARVLSDMEAEIVALELRLEKARQMKQGMMQELLTGRIRLA